MKHCFTSSREESHSSPVSLKYPSYAPLLLSFFGVSYLAPPILPGTSILAFLGALHLLISSHCVCVPHMTSQWLPPSSSFWLVIVRASSGILSSTRVIRDTKLWLLPDIFSFHNNKAERKETELPGDDINTQVPYLDMCLQW